MIYTYGYVSSQLEGSYDQRWATILFLFRRGIVLDKLQKKYKDCTVRVEKD